MADLAASAVTKLLAFTYGGMADKTLVKLQATVVLAAMGTSTNKILATAFGLTKIVAVTSVVKSDSTRYIGTPSYDNTYIQLMDPISATNIGEDVTGTFTFVIEGY